MRGSEPHDRWYVAKPPRSRDLRRIGDPADSGCEGSPDRDRAPSLARRQHVGWFAGASLRCAHRFPAISLPRRPAPGDGPDKAGQLTSDRGSDDIGRVAAAREFAVARAQPQLRFPDDLADWPGLRFLSEP